MTNYSLIETRRVRLENEEEIKLDYYLTDTIRQMDDEGKCIDEVNLIGDETNLYGVKLVKSGAACEEDEILGVTVDEQVAMKLIKVLIENEVTPISLVDVVDDWSTEVMYS